MQTLSSIIVARRMKASADNKRLTELQSHLEDVKAMHQREQKDPAASAFTKNENKSKRLTQISAIESMIREEHAKGGGSSRVSNEPRKPNGEWTK